MLSSIDAIRFAYDLWEPDTGIPTDPSHRFRDQHLAAPGAHAPEELRNYQNVVIGKILNAIDDDLGAIPALEPGAGKTGATLTAIRRALDAGKIRKVLIVAPLLVAKTVWPEEIYEWLETACTTWTLLRVEDDHPAVVAAGRRAFDEAKAFWQDKFDAERHALMQKGYLKANATTEVRRRWHAEAMEARTVGDKMAKTKLRVTPSEKAEAMQMAAILAEKDRQLALLTAEPTEIHIINKQALPWLWSHTGQGRDWDYDLIVCDDLREGRSGKKRTLKSKKEEKPKGPSPLSRFGILAQARKKVKAIIEMTGTPTPKGLENLWGLTYLIDRGERLGTSKQKFLEKWFIQDRYSYKVKPREQAFDEIMDKVKDIMFSLNPNDLAELPDFVIDPIRVKLPAEVRAAYKKFKRDLYSAEYDVEAANSGVLHGKLLQFANGSMYNEDGADVPIHDCKIEALRGLVERLDGTPLLVFYTYKFDVLRIKKEFPDAVVLSPSNAVDTVRRWNRDEIEILLAHRESAGHGLNMQKGTGHMCEYGLTADVELFLQAKKRLHRSGRKSTVFNHVIIAEDTIDEDIYPQYLDPRIAEQNRILKAVEIRL